MGEPARYNSYSQLAPGFAIKLRLGVRDARRMGLPVALFEGWRSYDRQAWLFAQGKSNAPTGDKGWHTKGLAGDVAFVDKTGEWYWPSDDDPRWAQLESCMNKHGLATGRQWKSIHDAPHVQPANIRVTPSHVSMDLIKEGGLVRLWEFLGYHVVQDTDLEQILG